MNQSEEEEDSDHDDDHDQERLSLLPQNPPPLKRYISPFERIKMMKQQQQTNRTNHDHHTHHATANRTATTTTNDDATSTRRSPHRGHRRHRRRRRLVKRYYDDVAANDDDDDWHKSPYDDDPHGNDNYDSVCQPFLLGLALFCILSSFWLLDVLKDPIFGMLLRRDDDHDGGGHSLESQLPTAKLVSVLVTTSLVLFFEYQSSSSSSSQSSSSSSLSPLGLSSPLSSTEIIRPTFDIIRNEYDFNDYSKHHWNDMDIVDSIAYRQKKKTEEECDNNNDPHQRVPITIFMTVGIPYCMIFAIMAYLIQFHYHRHHNPHSPQHDNDVSAVDADVIQPSSSRSPYHWTILGYFWFAAIESYGSICVATFWSYVNSILSLHDAETYYGYIISLGQLGAILGTTLVTTNYYHPITLIVLSCFIILLHIVIMYLYHNTYVICKDDHHHDDHRHNHNHTNNNLNSNIATTVIGAIGTKTNTGSTNKDTTTTTNNHRTTMITSSSSSSPSSFLSKTAQPNTTAAAAASSSTHYKTTTTTKWYYHIIDPSLVSGIYLILKYNYVLLLLGVSCLYEISLTILNYQMTLLGWDRYEVNITATDNDNDDDHILIISETNPISSFNHTSTTSPWMPDTTTTTTATTMMTFTQFMGRYGQMVNVTSLLLSSIVFPYLIQTLGLRRTLWIFPILLLLSNMLVFVALPGNLTILLYVMALLKAVTYSIHDPSKEILYIPTSYQIKYKAKFWIDIVGARFAKAMGATMNAHAGSVVRSIRMSSTPSILTSLLLFYTCYHAGYLFDQYIATGYIVGRNDDNDTTTSSSSTGPIPTTEHYDPDDVNENDNNSTSLQLEYEETESSSNTTTSSRRGINNAKVIELTSV